MKNYGAITASVTEFVVLLLGLTFIGHWVDLKTHHPGRYIFVGVFLGFGVGMIRLAKKLKKIIEDTDKEYTAEKKLNENESNGKEPNVKS